MAETYKLELYARGLYVGSELIELISLSEYNYSDEEWDALPEDEKLALLDEWGEEFFWSQGFEYGAEVKRG